MFYFTDLLFSWKFPIFPTDQLVFSICNLSANIHEILLQFGVLKIQKLWKFREKTPTAEVHCATESSSQKN